MKWSDNVKDQAPELLEPEAVGSLRDRAYPYADTVVTHGRGGGQPLPFIVVKSDRVTFRGQRGPIKDVGVNGCQIDDMITFALGTIRTFNAKFPCEENDATIEALEEALQHLEDRRVNREARGVEGKDLE